MRCKPPVGALGKVVVSMMLWSGLALLVTPPVIGGAVIGGEMKKAVFAGGCFWCMEPAFEKLDGVKMVVSGYAGGSEKNPSYEAVSSAATSHVEAVEITYDPEKVNYEILLNTFWQNIDPTQRDGQFADRGPQYKTVIFYNDENEKKRAEKSKKALGKSGKFKDPIVTDIRSFSTFYRAEEYHQDYYKKNPDHYKNYRWGSGRGPFLEQVWG
jgi:peptide methionine sulfoxide reductase msrA/msrB